MCVCVLGGGASDRSLTTSKDNTHNTALSLSLLSSSRGVETTDLPLVVVCPLCVVVPCWLLLFVRFVSFFCLCLAYRYSFMASQYFSEYSMRETDMRGRRHSNDGDNGPRHPSSSTPFKPESNGTAQ